MSNQVALNKKYAAYPEYKDSGAEWLEQIPSSWDVIRVGHLFKRVKRTGFEDRVLLSVYRDYGVVPKNSRDDNNNRPSDDLSPYQLVEPKDLVLNKMKAWQGSVAVSDFEGIVSPAYFVYKPVGHRGETYDSKFMHYLLRCPVYIAQYFRHSKGIRVNQWDLDPDSFKAVEVLLPSPEEQRTIAAFLDYETARIDQLIAKQQRLIELLKEKRQAVISHAVTKGLNPDAPMKDSGVEWLGQVPEHWVVQKLGYLCKVTKLTGFEYTNYWSPDDLGDVVALRGYNIGERKLELEKGTERISTALSNRLARSKLNAGDLVLPCTGTLGNAAVIPTSNTYHINQNIAKLTFDVTVLPEYASYWLTSSNFRRMVDHNNTSGMQPVLLIGDIRNMRIPIPPVEEQQTLVDCLNKDMARFELVVSKALFSLTLLQERRTALISAAVTGKIDLRGWRPPVRDAVA